jgi:hypothetical protein
MSTIDIRSDQRYALTFDKQRFCSIDCILFDVRLDTSDVHADISDIAETPVIINSVDLVDDNGVHIPRSTEFLRFGRRIPASRAGSFLRFGRSNSMFLRFGRATSYPSGSNSFLRFGRATSYPSGSNSFLRFG